MTDEDPTYEELLEENYELHEERKTIKERLHSLENELTEERKTGQDNEHRAIEVERLQAVANHAREEAAERKRDIEQHAKDRDTWDRTRERLQTALREKEDRQ